MRLLLDSHTILWLLTDDDRIPTTARNILGGSDIEAFASIISLWELRIKAGLGRLRLPEHLPDLLRKSGLRLLALTVAHTDVVEGFPHHHRDPFDRMLIAQAQAESMILVTGDRTMKDYGVPILWS